MNEYIIMLESKDGQKYEYTCYAQDEDFAKLKSLQSIQNKGWDVYDYKIINVKRLLNVS